jgi:hypothetical protein
MKNVIEWISENYQAVFSIIGAAFVFLRVLVAATPTPKDDQLAEKAEGYWQKFLAFASKVFGIDTTQGVNKEQ